MIQTDFDSQVADLVAQALMGENHHAISGGHRSNGFRMTIKALEAINQLIIARNGAALVASESLNESVKHLRSMGTPFAACVWESLVALFPTDS